MQFNPSHIKSKLAIKMNVCFCPHMQLPRLIYQPYQYDWRCKGFQYRVQWRGILFWLDFVEEGIKYNQHMILNFSWNFEVFLLFSFWAMIYIYEVHLRGQYIDLAISRKLKALNQHPFSVFISEILEVDFVD